jgi:hypothetical protein
MLVIVGGWRASTRSQEDCMRATFVRRLFVLGAIAALPVTGYSQQAAKPWNPPRTPDGQPDLQGSWVRNTGPGSPSHSLEEGSEPLAFTIQGRDPKTARMNVVVDPTDGKIPYQPWAAAKRQEHLVNLFTPTRREHVDPDDRCLLNGAPRQMYGGGFQLVQIPGYVLFLFENSHAYRIVPMDKRPHLGERIKLWMGDSRGHWEGDTLVVEVTNQNDQTWLDSHGTFHSDAMRVVERFTPVNADTIRYEATIEDPQVFTRPWKIALPLNRNKANPELWEEACHEGEQSVEHMISAGRLAKEAGKTGIHTHDLAR